MAAPPPGSPPPPSTTVTSAPASSGGSGGPSPDGSILVAGAGDGLVTSAGNWTFGPTNPISANYAVFLNGSYQGRIGATDMAIENGGYVYMYDAGAWYKYNGSGFVQSTDPNMPAPPPGSPPPPSTTVTSPPVSSGGSGGPSPDGSTLLPGAGDSLV